MMKDSIRAGLNSAVKSTSTMVNEKRRFYLQAAAAGGLALLTGKFVHAEQPKKGGRLVAAMANGSIADTLDPAKGAHSSDWVRHFMLYSGLLEMRNDQPQLALAESIESNDGQVWHIRLKRNIHFHDGKPLDAEDVVFSLMRHKDPAVASKGKALADIFKNAKAQGKDEVILELNESDYDLPALLTSSYFLIVPAGTTDFSRALGTGPFKLKNFVPGRVTEVVRNENFWKPGLPYLDEVQLMILTDKPARTNALLAGNLHISATLDARDVDRIKETGSHDVLITHLAQYTNLVLRQDAPITSNQDLVLVFKYMQDRERLKDTVLQGYATVANDHPVPPWHPEFLADLPQRPYDVDRARFHVEKSGLKGSRLELVTHPTLIAAMESAQMLQQVGSKVGLDIRIRRVPTDGYWTTHWLKHPITYGSIVPRPALSLLFSLFYRSDASNNESAWKNAKFDQLLMSYRKEADKARRKQICGDMQTLIYEGCGTIIPVMGSSIDGFNKRVKGFVPDTSGMLMGYQFPERVWLDG